MLNLSDFFPGVRIEAQGCPDVLLLKAVRDTVRDLCGTYIWTEDLYEISVAAGYSEYDIEIPSDASLMSILSARVDGVPVPIYTTNDMDDLVNDWRDESGPSITAVIADTSSTILVYPVPSQDKSNALRLAAALRPSMTATTCGDVLEDWSEAIEHGALARLKAMSNKSWTAQQDVAFHRAEYKQMRGEARERVLRGRSDKSLMVEPREFGL